MNLKELKKRSDGKIVLNEKLVEGQKIGEIEVKEPLEIILSSKGNYDILKYRERQIPEDAEVYSVEEIGTVISDSFQMNITDYKLFKVEFYKNIN